MQRGERVIHERARRPAQARDEGFVAAAATGGCGRSLGSHGLSVARRPALVAASMGSRFRGVLGRHGMRSKPIQLAWTDLPHGEQEDQRNCLDIPG
ncbi:MAG: hypothetical protein HYU36_22125 [Planctomycetes bacterium]|nr:hypothetical protein [Planctomycetota bacterium]